MCRRVWNSIETDNHVYLSIRQDNSHWPFFSLSPRVRKTMPLENNENLRLYPKSNKEPPMGFKRRTIFQDLYFWNITDICFLVSHARILGIVYAIHTTRKMLHKLKTTAILRSMRELESQGKKRSQNVVDHRWVKRIRTYQSRSLEAENFTRMGTGGGEHNL